MENIEVKHPYEKPEIQVIELDNQPVLLSSSGEPNQYGKTLN